MSEAERRVSDPLRRFETTEEGVSAHLPPPSPFVMASDPEEAVQTGLPLPGPLGETGKRVWVIAGGYLPDAGSDGPAPAMSSREVAHILNATRAPAELELWLFFDDREPAGPYWITVPPERTRQVCFSDLTDPEPVPRETDFASVFRSSTPVVIQYTRLDCRQPAHALASGVAWSE